MQSPHHLCSLLINSLLSAILCLWKFFPKPNSDFLNTHTHHPSSQKHIPECKLVQPPWRTVWRFLKKLEIDLPCDPAIPLLGVHTEETRIERDTCTPVFNTALFTMARTWRQPRCPSADEWIRKLWYIYTMEYYAAIKKNSFESVLMRWMKLEPIIE